jgi:hypothetical protein
MSVYCHTLSYVQAKRVGEEMGVRARDPTERFPNPTFMALQEVPLSIDLKTPPPQVPAKRV